MKFEFDVEKLEIKDHFLERIGKSPNAIYELLHKGYSWHIPIQLRPDDILNSVGAIWAKYIVIKAEEFRDFFVEHEGKKELVYMSGGTYSENRLPEFFRGLLDLVKNDQDNDNMSWLEFNSTVSVQSDQFYRNAVLLASQKEYYEYKCMLCCGFSDVELLGSENDWQKLIDNISNMPCPDNKLKSWRDSLIKMVEGMISGNEDFWQTCVTKERGGSGPQTIQGWIVNFSPFDESGKWSPVLEKSDLLDLTVDFPLKVDDNGHEFDLKITASNKCQYNEFLSLTNSVVAEESGKTLELV